jgi:hypothetical protein
MLKADQLIGSTPLRAGEELRIVLSPFRAQCYLHARRWYQDDGRWLPGKGLAVRIDMLPWLLAVRRTTEETALREGLLLPEDYTNAGLPAPDEAA